MGMTRTCRPVRRRSSEVGAEVVDRRLDGALEGLRYPFHRMLRPEGVAGAGHDLELGRPLPARRVQPLRLGGGDAVILLAMQEEPWRLDLTRGDLEVEPVGALLVDLLKDIE